MAAELISSATSNKLKETDWTKNIEICELVARDHRQAKDVVKAIKKRLESKHYIRQLFAVESKHENCQLFAVMLLEMLMNNIGEPVHKQVVEAGILPILVKIVKKKSEHPVRERIFLLLDAAQTSVGGASGRFPQYYSAYYELVSAGVKFPHRPRDIPKPQSASIMKNNNPADKNHAVPQAERNSSQVQKKSVFDPSRALMNAAAVMEVLRDVLDTIDTKHPEAAKDEFTLGLVEHCCYEKHLVIYIAGHSVDVGIIVHALEVNEQLEIVLKRHARLVGRVTRWDDNKSNKHGHGQEQEEEEAEQRFHRMRKGKAHLQPEDEPVYRQTEAKHTSPDHELGVGKPAVVIPPPPAKHVEREKFFQGYKSDGSALSGRMSSLSWHSRDASSSRSGSTDFSDT